MLTEKAVEFDVEDVWFAPLGSPLEKISQAAAGEPKDFRERINNKYYLIHYYGFHLPKNKFNVEQIVVPKNLVTVIEDVTHISEAKRLQRKVHRARRGQYSFTGIQNR